MSVQKLNQNNFNNAIANGTALVDFYADWCGPCRIVSPIVDEIAEERSDITVGKVNVDDENALAMKYGVMSIPTLIVFKDGKEKTRIVGARPKAAILAGNGFECYNLAGGWRLYESVINERTVPEYVCTECK